VYQSSADTAVPLLSGLSLPWTDDYKTCSLTSQIVFLSGAGQDRPMLTPIFFVLKSQRLEYPIFQRIAVLGFTSSREIDVLYSNESNPVQLSISSDAFLASFDEAAVGSVALFEAT